MEAAQAPRFSGRTHLVCGARAGLGLAVAELILRDGGEVFAVSRRPALPEFTEEGLHRVEADLATAAGVQAVVSAVREAGAVLDGILVNGGGPPPGAVLSLGGEEWHGALDALVVRPLELIKGLRESLAPLASVLFITSSSAREPLDQLGASNVLRPGVAALAHALSRELAPDVRVNSIAPGRIATARLNEVEERQAAASGADLAAHRRQVETTIPLGRLGTPHEFAEVATFLLSPAAAYVTGAAIQVDGGLVRAI